VSHLAPTGNVLPTGYGDPLTSLKAEVATARVPAYRAINVDLVRRY
jgi:hypothetical protein